MFHDLLSEWLISLICTFFLHMCLFVFLLSSSQLTYLFIHLLTYLPTHCFTCMHDWSSHSVASLLSHLLRHSLAFSFLQLLTHIHHYHLPTCLTTKFSDSARCCWLFSVLGLLEWLVHHSLIPDLLTLVARSPSGLLTQLMKDMPPLLLHSLSSLTHSLTHVMSLLLTYLLTCLIACLLACSLACLVTDLITHSLTYLFPYLLEYLLTYWHTYLQVNYLRKLVLCTTHLLTWPTVQWSFPTFTQSLRLWPTYPPYSWFHFIYLQYLPPFLMRSISNGRWCLDHR